MRRTYLSMGSRPTDRIRLDRPGAAFGLVSSTPGRRTNAPSAAFHTLVCQRIRLRMLASRSPRLYPDDVTRGARGRLRTNFRSLRAPCPCTCRYVRSICEDTKDG